MKSKLFILILSVVLFSQISFAKIYEKLIDIRAGEHHTLALSEDGNLYSCGGGDGETALGLGNISGNVLYLNQVKGPNGVGELNNVIAFDAGWVHSLAVVNGFCYAWGANFSGSVQGILGNGPSGQSSNVPINVHAGQQNPNDPNAPLQHIIKISAGRSGLHSLAVDCNEKKIYAWGWNYYRQCGDGQGGENRVYPVLVVDSCDQTQGRYLGDEANIVDVEAGVAHSLALTKFEEGGFVYEWGNGNIPIPRKVVRTIDSNGTKHYLENIKDIATCNFSLAVDSNENVWQWTTGGTPAKIPSGEQTGTEYLSYIVKVAAGNGKYAALDANGNIWVWDNDKYPAKVHDGEMKTESGFLENIIAFDVGYYNHFVAVDKYGRGWAWGENGYGQLGVLDTTARLEPTQMFAPLICEPNVWNKTKDTWHPTIGDAVYYANDSGDVLIAYPGVYNENVDFGSKQLTLKSSDPNDPFIVARTAISGIIYYQDAAVKVANDSTLDGFTICNDYYGIYCGNSSNLTIKNCRITYLTYGIYCRGTNLTVSNCRLDNPGEDGLNCAGGTVTITDTSINKSGSAGILNEDAADIIIDRCRFFNAGVCYWSGGSLKITNSIIHKCGISVSDGSTEIRNNTIVGSAGHGIQASSGNTNVTVNSNIIWGNGDTDLDCNSSGSVNYNCIEDGWLSGTGNISSDPCFRNPDANDFHLTGNSNCIEAGNPDFIAEPNETDIDGEDRIDANRVDIGADEFHYCSGRIDIFPDGIVNFSDFVVIANTWLRSDPNQYYNALADFVDNNKIDVNDLREFCECWLWQTDFYEPVENGGEVKIRLVTNPCDQGPELIVDSQESFVELDSVAVLAEESVFDSQEILIDSDEMMMESQESQPPVVYLTCDTNSPDPNDEVTVYIHTDVPLGAMGLFIDVIGDANITGAMCEADCNEFGWDNGWDSDPYIDPNGWVFVNGVKWEGSADDTVGYMKFRYNSGQVSVMITDGDVFDVNCQPLSYSSEALLFEYNDPNN